MFRYSDKVLRSDTRKILHITSVFDCRVLERRLTILALFTFQVECSSYDNIMTEKLIMKNSVKLFFACSIFVKALNEGFTKIYK